MSGIYPGQSLEFDTAIPLIPRRFARGSRVMNSRIQLNGVQGVGADTVGVSIGASRRLIVSAGWPLLIVGEKNAQSQNTQDI
jgi:hypothetical protein